jgi:hypothetical protein
MTRDKGRQQAMIKLIKLSDFIQNLRENINDDE